jgi:hypothetical protein
MILAKTIGMVLFGVALAALISFVVVNLSNW